MSKYTDIFPIVRESATSICGESITLSYPMPDICGGVRIDCFFIFSQTFSLKRKRPFAFIFSDAENGNILKYQDCRTEDFIDTNEHPIDEIIDYTLPRKLGIKEFKIEQDMINKLYDGVRNLAFRDRITKLEADLLVRHLLMLESSVPKELLPFYKAIGKNYYDWVMQYV